MNGEPEFRIVGEMLMKHWLRVATKHLDRARVNCVSIDSAFDASVTALALAVKGASSASGTNEAQFEIIGMETLTAAEFAVAVGFTSTYITRLCREGKLQARKSSAGWLIDARDLQRFGRAA